MLNILDCPGQAPQRITQPQMSVVLRLKNPELNQDTPKVPSQEQDPEKKGYPCEGRPRPLLPTKPLAVIAKGLGYSMIVGESRYGTAPHDSWSVMNAGRGRVANQEIHRPETSQSHSGSWELTGLNVGRARHSSTVHLLSTNCTLGKVGKSNDLQNTVLVLSRCSGGGQLRRGVPKECRGGGSQPGSSSVSKAEVFFSPSFERCS